MWVSTSNIQNGMTGEFWFPEIMGGGAAIFDYDRDGRKDLYMLQGGWLLNAGSEHKE